METKQAGILIENNTVKFIDENGIVTSSMSCEEYFKYTH